MKQLVTFILSVAIALVSTTAEAQIVDRSKERAKDKANNRVDSKIDKGIDGGLDALEGLFKRKPKKNKGETTSDETEGELSEEETMNMTGNLFGGGNVEMEDEYAFDRSIEMTVEMIDKKGKEEYAQNMEMLFAENETYIGILTTMADEGVSNEAKMVMDMEQKQMITLIDSPGMKIAMAIDLTAAIEDSNEETEPTDTFMSDLKKTGRTKELLGYTCYEYAGEDEDNTFEFWAADEDMMNIYGAFAAMQSANPKKGAATSDNYPKGMMMESTTVSKRNGEKNIMRVTKVNLAKSQTISTVGYQQMGLPGGK
jgi:hypothetical protein